MRNIIICLLMALPLTAMGQGIIKHDTRTVTKTKATPNKKTTGTPQNPVARLLKDMVRVEGGTYTMGTDNGQANERPAHQATVASFYICKYEVTQELWRAIMGPTKFFYKGRNLPATEVNWLQCQLFIQKLNARTGKHFRLPTEEEWEWAARGGNRSRGYRYSGSDDCGKVAWYYSTPEERLPHSVGTKKPNELGLYDMSGNAMEWVSDAYGTYGQASRTYNPDQDKLAVGRGGSFYGSADQVSVYARDGRRAKDKWMDDMGLRLAASAL